MVWPKAIMNPIMERTLAREVLHIRSITHGEEGSTITRWLNKSTKAGVQNDLGIKVLGFYGASPSSLGTYLDQVCEISSVLLSHCYMKCR
jgi:hypothetical protein